MMTIGALWRLENNLRLGIVGNPENRRVRDFQATAERLGLKVPQCVSWLDVIHQPGRSLQLLATFELVRLESAGENAAVQHGLARLGGASDDTELALGELGLLRESYLGFAKMLNRIAGVDTLFHNSPSDVGLMFDKWQSHEMFVEAGLPRPQTAVALPTTVAFRDQRAAFGSVEYGRLFLKPRYGSSASGVCAYRWSGDREQIIAPIELDRRFDKPRLFNSLRIRSYTRLEDTEFILSQLLPQDMICEQWIKKARLPDGRFDLRILVIAGEARHCVVRQSQHPMTNLHLGNTRADIAQVQDLLGAEPIGAARQCAERAAACFPSSLYAGVDILIDSRGELFVCEINAFGDLLPRLEHRGESAYEAILRAAFDRVAVSTGKVL